MATGIRRVFRVVVALLAIATRVQAQDQFNSSSGSEAGSGGTAQSCNQAYFDTERQIVVAGTLVDANFKKQEIDCNGDQSCRRAAGKEYDAQLREIAKQQVDASAQHAICVAQSEGGNGGAPSAPPGSPHNPLRGYVTNAPQAPGSKVPVPPQSPPKSIVGTSGGAPSQSPAAPPPHSPLYILNNALNDAISRIPNGSQNLQNAGRLAGQVDKTVNGALNDTAQKMKAIRDSMAQDMINKWTHPMSAQDALVEVGTTYVSNAVGTGVGVGVGTLLKGGVAGGMTKTAAQAGAAALKAAGEEAAVTAGAASAVRGAGGALASRGAPGESGGGPEGAQPAPPANGGQPAQEQPPAQGEPQSPSAGAQQAAAQQQKLAEQAAQKLSGRAQQSQPQGAQEAAAQQQKLAEQAAQKLSGRAEQSQPQGAQEAAAQQQKLAEQATQKLNGRAQQSQPQGAQEAAAQQQKLAEQAAQKQPGRAQQPQEPPAISGSVEQMGQQFTEDFGSDAAKHFGAGTGFGNSSAPPCFARNACFNTAMAQARLWATEESYAIQGVADLGKSDLKMTGEEIRDILRQQFGGSAAANSPAYTAVERAAQKQGIPISVTPGRLNQILGAGRNGNQWLIFIRPPTGIGHVFNARFINNSVQMLDVTQKMDGRLWFSIPLKDVFIYQLH